MEAAPSHPEIRRIVAPNPGPMTLAGTNTYVVGTGPVYVIDPGPADTEHLARVMAAAGGEIAGVVLTHSHADHSAGVEALGAPLLWGEVGQTIDLSQPAERPSDRRIGGSQGRSPGRVGPFEVIATPGHAVDHVALVLGDVCFCGDLVLGEGSSIVLPGGGGLAAYLDSLERLRERSVELLCPGHGPWIADPAAKLAEYRAHRLDRERKLVAALDRGERSRDGLLDAAWDDVPPELRPAAALAMQVHLEKLYEEGRLPDDLDASVLPGVGGRDDPSRR